MRREIDRLALVAREEALKESMKEEAVLERLAAWGEQTPSVQAMLLYSSRTTPGAPVDAFSDYDVLVLVDEVQAFYDDDRWLEAFGEVLVVFRNPVGVEWGFESFGFITTYVDGTKIDYGIFPRRFLDWAVQQPQMPEDLDTGYRVLLDKTGLAGQLPPPTYQAYIHKPPTEHEYRTVIDEFYNDSLYVARNLRRDNLFIVKLCLDQVMKFTCLRKMLDWRAACAHGWKIKTGAHGKGLKQWVEPGLWAELESTYVGAGRQENWDALHRTLDLFSRLAREVGAGLGYAFPDSQEKRVRELIAWIQDFQGHPETPSNR